MSASDPMLSFAGRSSHDDPVAALCDALGQIARQMGPAGAGPQHLVSMTYRARNIADFHPARRDILNAYREIFVGFRPKTTFERSDSSLEIIATVRQSAQTDETPVWRDYSLVQLAGQYSARSQVPDMQPVFRQWSRDGAAFRAQFKSLNIAYGPNASETFDLYHPRTAARAPLWVFIHGGYWQAVTKEQNAQFAAGLVRAGYAVANLDYGLCPETPLSEIVEQAKRALNFISANADALDINAQCINLVGHSAGAHLAGLLAVDKNAPPIHSALLISGIFELAPLALLPMGRILGLSDDATVARLSVSSKKPRGTTRIGLALGALESDEFKRQSNELAASWRCDAPLMVAERNHFTILDELVAGKLLDLAVGLTGKKN